MAGSAGGGRPVSAATLNPAEPASDQLRGYREAFDALQAQADPRELRAVRATAFARFEALGFPTVRDEAFRSTSLAPLTRTLFQTRPQSASDATPPLLGSGPRLVFVNGEPVPALSRGAGDGVELLSLRDALAAEPHLVESHLALSGSSFTALNTAFLSSGAVLRVRAGHTAPEPLQVAFHASGGDIHPWMTHPRLLVLAEAGSQATVIETYSGTTASPYLTNALSQIEVGEAARVAHYRIQREDAAAFHIATTRVRQGRASHYTSVAVNLGAALMRHELDQAFTAEGGECQLDGLFLATGAQHTDTHTMIDHAWPHCVSRQTYKGILDGHARGVFHGTVLVRKDAQKTDARQTNKNLLLSRDALVDSTPVLTIFADDVKCKHGSTTGALDAQALFYLRSRGIGEAAARSLLTWAFASEIVDRIATAWLREPIAALVRHDLQEAL